MRFRQLALAGTFLATAASLSAVALPRAGAQGSDGSKDDLGIVSVSVVGKQTVRAVVDVPPTFDQVDLKPESFAVTVDGALVPPHITRDIQPVDVVLAIDVSGSMAGDAMNAAKIAANQFISRIPSTGRVGVVAFSDEARVVAPLSLDHTPAAAAVGQLEAHGETSLYDGLRNAAMLFDDPGRRHELVLLSDGKDTVSVAAQADAVASLTSNGVDMYAIAFQTSDTDRNSLGGLVGSVGGRLIEAGDSATLSSAYDEIAVRITNRYVIDLTSSARGDVKLSVSVAQGGKIATATTTARFDRTPTSDVPQVMETTAPSVVASPHRTWIDSIGLEVGVAGLVAGLILIVTLLSSPAAPARRLARELGSRTRHPTFDLNEARQRLVGSAEQLLDRSDKRAFLDRALEDAAIDMRPAEFIVMAGGTGAALALVTWIATNFLVAVLVALSFVIGARLFLSMKASSRRSKFLRELDSALTTMAGSLRAGQGLPQALDTVARETDGPISDEFGRVVLENRLGRDVVESLHGVERRVGGGDFSWVVKAISIQRELGGDLAEVLDNVAATIRDRNRVRAHVRAMSAEGRFSAIVLFALPIFTVGAVAVFSPKYLASMTEGALGWVVVALTVAMMGLGGLWMRKIVRIRF